MSNENICLAAAIAFFAAAILDCALYAKTPFWFRRWKMPSKNMRHYIPFSGIYLWVKYRLSVGE